MGDRCTRTNLRAFVNLDIREDESCQRGSTMTALRNVDRTQVEDPSELAETLNDIYRRIAALEVAIKMTRQSEVR